MSKVARNTKRDQILNALRMSGDKGVSNEELSNITLRYGARISELYKLGYQIEKINLGNELYQYILVHEPEVERADRISAFELLVRELSGNEVSEGEMRDSLNSLFDKLGIAVRYKVNTHNTAVR